METLYRKGDILTAIDPCIMDNSKYQALIPGKEYVIFKSTRNTIWINSEIGEHQFEIEELSEFFDEVIKSDNTETLANALQQIEKLEADKAELLEALRNKIVIFKANSHQSAENLYKQSMETSAHCSEAMATAYGICISEIESLIQKHKPCGIK